MKLRKKLIPFLVLTACLVLFCSMPVFAAELTEADVEAAVASQGKEAVTGNVFVWFLCAIAFLKVSQKIDSFLASLGINVGNTGGNMMAELLIAGRSLTGSMRSHGGGGYHKASSPGSAAVAGSFLSGGLAGLTLLFISYSPIPSRPCPNFPLRAGPYDPRTCIGSSCSPSSCPDTSLYPP